MLENGEIVNLSNNKEYVVVNTIKLHNTTYVFLVSNFKPVDIVIATEKIVDDNIVLDEVTNTEELDYILSKFALTKEDAEEFD